MIHRALSRIGCILFGCSRRDSIVCSFCKRVKR
jgi:hypothetical protein